MFPKRMTAAALALALCCAVAACAAPAAPAAPSGTPAAWANSLPEEPEAQTEETEKEETAMDHTVTAPSELLPDEGMAYNGILVELEEGANGLSLVMVPLDTPEADRGDYLRQYVFHTGEETDLRVPREELRPGAELAIRHNGIATRSLPPQGFALEVRRLGDCR